MKKILCLLVICSFTFIISGCAVMLSTNRQDVTFTSTTPATVKMNMKEVGKTNVPIEIKRKDMDKLFRVSAEGCVTKELELPLKTNGLFWLNVPLVFVPYMGLIPAYIDLVFDGNVKTEPIINVELDCSGKKP